MFYRDRTILSHFKLHELCVCILFPRHNIIHMVPTYIKTKVTIVFYSCNIIYIYVTVRSVTSHSTNSISNQWLWRLHIPTANGTNIRIEWRIQIKPLSVAMTILWCGSRDNMASYHTNSESQKVFYVGRSPWYLTGFSEALLPMHMSNCKMT